MSNSIQRDSAVDILLPSVREIRHLDESRSLTPSTSKPEHQGSRHHRIANALRRYGLDGYLVRFLVGEDIDREPWLADDYGYELEVSQRGVEIRAKSTWGAITACSVLAALAWRDGSLPYCHLVDQPTYPWRGLMIDTSRHFISIESLKETLELMACYRLNVLHLSLSNDQACRFRSERYPRLASAASYSAEELRDLIGFAADRAIRIVPELDVPGHTTSWIWAYPAWGSGQLTEPSNGFGVHEACLDPTKSEVIDATKHVFDELAEVFPDSHVHIGGDEVNPAWWDQNSRIQAWMRSHGMATAHELQTWFITELGDHLKAMGKQVIGWDEILATQLPKDYTIQAWRGVRALEAAHRGGHATIVSSPYYLDLFLPVDYHYRYFPSMTIDESNDADTKALSDPRLAHVQDGLRWQASFGTPDSEARRAGGNILGGEACMWSEIVDDETLHTRVWSRMPAIAERFWSGDRSLDEASVYARLERGIQFWRWKFNINKLMTIPPELDPPALHPLIEQLEPVKWYARLIGMSRVIARTSGQLESAYVRPYDLNTELNRVVDYLPPESFEARRLEAALRDSLPLTKWLDGWRNQADVFEDYVKKEGRLVELRELSRRLETLAAIHRGESPVDMSLAEPVGEYLLPVSTPILHKAIGQIGERFGASGGEVEEIKKGHINDTFVLDRKYLLQRINASVFDVGALLSNRRMLDEVIRDVIPHSLETADGADHFVGVNGEVWRAAEFIEARNFDVLPTELCKEAGSAFGGFLTLLQKCTKRPLPVIEGFHEVDEYLRQFDALEATPDSHKWVEFVNERRSSIQTFDPDEYQVIHGDCKVNNLLFDLDEPKASRIIDLDTIMWGHPAWDFGDLIRSVLTGAGNTEEEKTRIRLTTQGFITSYEMGERKLGCFAYAPSHMSFMLGIRFLADHFRGDTYFKVDARGDNLIRAAEQFALSERLSEVASDINEWFGESS